MSPFTKDVFSVPHADDPQNYDHRTSIKRKVKDEHNNSEFQLQH